MSCLENKNKIKSGIPGRKTIPTRSKLVGEPAQNLMKLFNITAYLRESSLYI